MAMGVGGITGALCGGRAVQWMGARRTTWVGLLVGGALLVVYSRQTTFIGGVVLLYVFAVPLTMLNTAMSPLLIAAAPPAYRGRVVAVFYPVTQLASMLAAVLAGWLAGSVLRGVSFSVAGAHFGPLDTIFAFSGVVVVLSGLYARAALPDPAKETDAAGADAAETGAAETEAPVANAADPGPVRPPDAVGRDAA
jgi:MFS family permease